MPICYRLSNSLPPERLEMLADFKRVADNLEMPFLLVGATVRQLILNSHYGVEERRKTYDLDFGVMLRDWESYERLAFALAESGKFHRENAGRRPHEFRFGTGNWIDVIPFGLIGGGNTIAWPPEGASVMNITGYDDVFRAAVEIDLGGNLQIRATSLPGYVLLKLFAWNDRPRERTKDLQDIWHLLENYYIAGEMDVRLHEEHSDLLDTPAENYRDIVGARVLGRDMRKLCSPDTHQSLRRLLERERDRGDSSNVLAVFEKEANAFGKKDSFEHVRICWNAFVEGCLENPPDAAREA